MSNVNIYSVLHKILQTIEPGNRIAFLLSRRCVTERKIQSLTKPWKNWVYYSLTSFCLAH